MAMEDGNKVPAAPDFETTEEWVKYSRWTSVLNHIAKGIPWLLGLVLLTQCVDPSDFISINIDWTNSN